MTKQELLQYIHQYSPEELHHLNNHDYIASSKGLDSVSPPLLADAASNFRLHNGNIPQSEDQTYDAAALFEDQKQPDIQIIQHDRYTQPLLHSHDFYELFYVYEGEFIQQVGGSKLLMHSGDFCLIPPGIYHSLDVRNSSIVLNILITKKKFQEIIMSGLNSDNILTSFFMGGIYAANVNDYVIFHTYGDRQLQDLVLDMCLEVLNREAYYEHFLNTHLLLLFGLLLRKYEATCELPVIKKKKDSQNFAILRYMEENFRTLSLPDLAARFGYSPQYMSARVKKITGVSFTDYLTQKRMAVASDLLINTSMKIRQISEDVGYENQEHFIRTFRKYYHTTPMIYRNMHGEDLPN